jgi:hypothetical protein
LLVMGAVNHGHAAGPELCNDAVMRDGVAEHWKVGEWHHSIAQLGRASTQVRVDALDAGSH